MVKFARCLAVLFLALGIGGSALADATLPPVNLPAALTDIGAPDKQPFVIAAMGQSNMVGQDHSGSKTVGANILISDDKTSPTVLRQAAFGLAPLNIATGGNTTNPALAYNNAAVQFANNLRASNLIPASRPIVIIQDWEGAQSISDWVDGTPYDMWARLTTQITLLQTRFPGATINHVMWMQGENDSSGTYGSAALYGAAFARLYARLQTLPQWTNSTTMSVQELGMWSANYSGAQRNDFLRTLKSGAIYPRVTMVSSSGLTQSTDNPGPHFDGNSLVTLGQRHFQAWRAAALNGVYHAQTTYWGAADAFPNLISPPADTNIQVNPDDLRTSLYLVANGGQVALPVPTPGMGNIFLYVNGPDPVSLTAGSAYLNFDNQANATAGPTALKNAFTYELVPVNGVWRVNNLFPRVGNLTLYVGGSTLSGTQAFTAGQFEGVFYSFTGGSAQVPANRIGDWGYIYATAATTITSSSSTFIGPAGQTVTSYVLPAGATALLAVDVNAVLHVLWDSSLALRASQEATPTTGTTVTVNPGFRSEALVLNHAATLAALTVALPAAANDNDEITVLTPLAAVTAVTYSGGTVAGAPAGLAAGGKLTLRYLAGSTRWLAN